MNCTLNLFRHVLSSAPNPYITMLVSEKIQFAFEMYLHFSMSCLNFLFIPPSSFILFEPHTRKNVYRNFLKSYELRKHNNFNNLTFSDSSEALICFFYKHITTVIKLKIYHLNYKEW